MGKQRKSYSDKCNNWQFLPKTVLEECRETGKKQHSSRLKGNTHGNRPVSSLLPLVKPKKVSYLNSKCHAVGIGSSSHEIYSTGKTLREAVPEEENETYALINELEIDLPHSTPKNSSHLLLRPIYFEVPQEEESHKKLVERHWIFSSILEIFSLDRNKRGIIIHGNPGTGKTTITLQLVEHSCFGRKKSKAEDNSPLIKLASQIVAYHFCQVENKTTCLAADFVHSIAAQICQAPLLEAFRIFIEENPNIQEILSTDNCLMDPNKAFIQGILEPLIKLRKCQHLPEGNVILLVDSICEAESHRPSNGDTIASFLSKHILRIPSWFKVIFTVRTSQLNILNMVPLKLLSLDAMSDQVDQDVRQYVSHRFESILSPDKPSAKKIDANVLPGLKTHLLQLSGGCFLFLKLTIDLIEHGHLIIKSNSFKVLPVSLHDVFLLHTNLRIPNMTIFNSVSPILSTCLVALSPLNLLEIYHSVNSLRHEKNLPWVEFLRLFKNVQGLLVKRLDGTYMFFHSSIRDWLLGKDVGNSKFQCCPEVGHAAIALRLLRVELPLSPTKILTLGHHVLKAKSLKLGFGSNFHSTLLLSSCENISAALCSQSNIYNTNLKVSRLLLQAGASPTAICEFSKKSILEICASEGNLDLLELFVKNGADLDSQNENGDTILHRASANGHLQVVHYLVENGSRVSKINSKKETPLTVAALSEQLHVVNFFLDSPWDERDIMDLSKHEAIVQSLVAACENGCISSVRHLLQKCPFINVSETFQGITPLIAACKSGNIEAIKLLLNLRSKGVNVDDKDADGNPALLYAVHGGQYNLLDLLLNLGCNTDATDSYGRTALMHAVQLGDIISAEALINQRCDINKRDSDGLSALSLACFQNNFKMVNYLLQYHVNIQNIDNLRRTALHIAASCKNKDIVHLLLDANSPLEQTDFQGNRPLDCAVEANCPEIAKLFLRKGAKLSANVWKKAANNSEMLLVFLNKLLEDGKFLLQNDQVADAEHRFQYAIKKVNSKWDDREIFKELRAAFLLEIEKCNQKGKVSYREQEAIIRK